MTCGEVEVRQKKKQLKGQLFEGWSEIRLAELSGATTAQQNSLQRYAS